MIRDTLKEHSFRNKLCWLHANCVCLANIYTNILAHATSDAWMSNVFVVLILEDGLAAYHGILFHWLKSFAKTEKDLLYQSGFFFFLMRFINMSQKIFRLSILCLVFWVNSLDLPFSFSSINALPICVCFQLPVICKINLGAHVCTCMIMTYIVIVSIEVLLQTVKKNYLAAGGLKRRTMTSYQED